MSNHEPIVPIVVGDGSNYANLVERSNDAEEDYRKAARKAGELEEQLRATLHPDIMNLIDELIERRGVVADAWTDLMGAELGRHLPGLAPVIMLLWDHVRNIHPRNVGHCCAGEGSYEPGMDDDGD